MERYLLFESACPICMTIAHKIQDEVDGWLVIKSLHDQEMQALLSHARPGWQWQPMLLLKDDRRLHVYSGLVMAKQLMTGLGVRRSWRILQTLNEVNGATNKSKGRFGSASSLLRIPVMLAPKPQLAEYQIPAGVKPAEPSKEETQFYTQQALESKEFALIKDKIEQVNMGTATTHKFDFGNDMVKWVVELSVPGKGYVSYALFERLTTTNRTALHTEAIYYEYEQERGGANYIIGGINEMLVTREALEASCGGNCSYSWQTYCQYCSIRFIQQVDAICCDCSGPWGSWMCCCTPYWRGPCANYC